MKIAIVGSGGWGTAISCLLSKNGHEVTLWSYLKEEAEMLTREREHKALLKGVILPQNVKITNDIACVAEAELIVVVTPSFAVASTAKSMKPYARPDQIIVCLTKGYAAPGFGR